MLEKVKSLLASFEKFRFDVVDIQNIPYEDNSFDIVIANMMLYHVPNLDKAFCEVKRVLKKDGTFYCATFGEDGLDEGLAKMLGTEAASNESSHTFTLQNGAKKLDNAAKGAALSLSGKVTAETQMGYLPFKQDRYLSEFVMEEFGESPEIEEIITGRAISAAGDIGDLSYMFPCIQIGYSGFKGTIHGDDFIDEDPEYIFSIFPEFVYRVLKRMSGKIENNILSTQYKRNKCIDCDYSYLCPYCCPYVPEGNECVSKVEQLLKITLQHFDLISEKIF